MVQSVELLVDAALDAAVRQEWAALVDAGLPSQARHAGASNAPHVTLAAVDALDAAADDRLAALDLAAGTPIVLGGLLVFTGRTSVLSRLVVPSVELLSLHADVQGAVPASTPDGTSAVGRWTPHVTLARRLDAVQLAAAVEVLRAFPRELDGSVADVRRWDGDRRLTWSLLDGAPRP